MTAVKKEKPWERALAVRMEIQAAELLEKSKMTEGEIKQVADNGLVYCTLNRAIEIAGVSKADAAINLDVKPAQVTNWNKSERMAEYNPKTREVDIIATERIVKQGVL